MQPVTPPPVRNPIDLIVANLNSTVNGFFLQLPNIVGGIIFLVFAWFVGGFVARGIRRLFGRRHHIDLGSVLGSIAFGAVMIMAVLVASVIIFPSVQPATVISSLGIGSVAIGFAFKDILQNLLAGILLLINRPFRTGDQIKVKDYEGTVEHIQSRATLIKTFDGRRVVIPNADVYTSPVTINTAFDTRRDQYDVGIGYGDDPAKAIAAFQAALDGVEGISHDNPREVLMWALDDSYVTLRLRWWTGSKRANIVHLRAAVMTAVHRAAVENGIDLPFPTTQVLFHDQTEDADGDRSRQREGWPAAKSESRPEGGRAPAEGDAARG